MHKLFIEIPGEPIAKARPRFAKHGNHVKTYDIQDNEKRWLKNLFKLATNAKSKWGNGIPLVMQIDCYFRPSNSFSKKELNLMSWGQLFHTKKPDASNLLKMYEDALNEIAFQDDRQLISVTVNKFYSHESKTIISIMPKLSYDETLHEFMEIINLEDFCALSYSIYELAFALKETKEISECQKINLTKNALIKLGSLADKHSKFFCVASKKYKNLIENLEKNSS